jgi:hypothetical protein
LGEASQHSAPNGVGQGLKHAIERRRLIVNHKV